MADSIAADLRSGVPIPRVPQAESLARAVPEGTAPRPAIAALALEGIFQTLAQGLGEAYLGAFALWLGAGGIALGLVATLPTAAGSAAQALARRARAGARSARDLILKAWSAQAVGYASLGLCLLLPPGGAVAALCLLALLSWGCGGLAIPAWTSLVGTVVPRGRHGWFFGRRGAAQQAGMLLAILGGAAILSATTGRGREGAGFAILFAAAGCARLAGALLLTGLPAAEEGPARRPRRRALAALIARGKFRRLALYLWALHFATYVSTPFFVPYMLRDLRFDYALVGAIVATPAIVKIATMRIWGHVADRFGPGPLLRSSGWLVVLVPAFWLVSARPLWIVLAQIYSGLAWGAFELAQASSILQATRGREREVALFNTIDGAMIIAGSLVGGATVNLWSGPSRSGFLATMLLSTALRAIPALALLWRIRGIGRPLYSHLRMPLRVFAVRPTRGIVLEPYGRQVGPER